MRDSQSSECLLRLSSSLQCISKCIRESREFLHLPSNNPAATTCHTSIRLNTPSPQNVSFNINLSFSEPMHPHPSNPVQQIIPPPREKARKNKKRVQEEKPFGQINLGQSTERVKGKRDENRDDEVFSFGDENDLIHEETNPTTIVEGNTDRTNDFWIGRSDDPIKIIEDSEYYIEYEENRDEFWSPDRVNQDEEDDTFGKESNGYSTNHKENQEETHHQSKTYQSYYLELEAQVSDSIQKYGAVRDQLNKTDQFIRESMEKHRRIQESASRTQRVSRQESVRNKMKEMEGRKNKKSERSPNPRSTERHNSLKLGLLAYFSKSPSARHKKPGVVCDKYIRQLSRDTKQRYLSQALKIPHVSKYFTFSQLTDFYKSFKSLHLPEYKWTQYIIKKIKGPKKFTIFSQFCAESIPK